MSETGIREGGSGLYDEGGRPLRSAHAAQQVEDLVRFAQEYPYMTALGALVLGYMLGKLT